MVLRIPLQLETEQESRRTLIYNSTKGIKLIAFFLTRFFRGALRSDYTCLI